MNEEESEEEEDNVAIVRGSIDSLHRRTLQMESGGNNNNGALSFDQHLTGETSSRANQPILTLSVSFVLFFPLHV